MRLLIISFSPGRLEFFEPAEAATVLKRSEAWLGDGAAKGVWGITSVHLREIAELREIRSGGPKAPTVRMIGTRARTGSPEVLLGKPSTQTLSAPHNRGTLDGVSGVLERLRHQVVLHLLSRSRRCVPESPRDRKQRDAILDQPGRMGMVQIVDPW